MTRHTSSPLLATALAVLLAGCHLPGRPGPGVEVPRPDQVTSFDQLYNQNCAGCHGADGQRGAATDLANPQYLALADDTTLHTVIAHGEPGTLMPAFAVSAGGTLTDAQIDDIIRGMRQRWGKSSGTPAGTPPYKATSPGDPAKGEAVYNAACARCHGAAPQQPQQSGPAPQPTGNQNSAPQQAAARQKSGPAGSILDGSYLALINDQTIRTTILAGRPDIGQPDFRNLIPGRPLTDPEITDVTAWLISQRPPHPGRPYPNTQPTSERPGEAQPHSEIGR
jgi:cytochrome c oxidase cbb3-type subunit 3